jgi:putative FmdB family regulatory protein
MPLYEYQCDNCNEKFEVMQKFADEPLTTHEKCGGGPVHRLVSAPSFNFKGSGWYVNDYAKAKSTPKDSSSSSSSSDSPAKSSETTKESKPSADSPSKSSPSTPSSDTK